MAKIVLEEFATELKLINLLLYLSSGGHGDFDMAFWQSQRPL